MHKTFAFSSCILLSPSKGAPQREAPNSAGKQLTLPVVTGGVYELAYRLRDKHLTAYLRFYLFVQLSVFNRTMGPSTTTSVSE